MLTEHTFIVDVFDAEPKPCGERAHQDVKVKEEGNPGGWLVLRNRSDDGDVDLSIPEVYTIKKSVWFGLYTML